MEVLEKGFAVFTAYAHGDKGLKQKLKMGIFSDPGYIETAKMAAEGSLALVFDEKSI